jgi:hypothetical protein
MILIGKANKMVLKEYWITFQHFKWSFKAIIFKTKDINSSYKTFNDVSISLFSEK